MISIIAAIGKNRELGLNNKLLWNIPEDMKRFRELTQGHAVIMGRKTFESIGRPLPNRLNIIITKDPNFLFSHPELVSGSDLNKIEKDSRSRNKFGMTSNIIVVNSLEQAIEKATSLRGARRRGNPDEIASHTPAMTKNDEIFVIGGGQIYEAAIKLADKLYLTIVEGSYEADTYFPDYSEFKKIISQKTGESSGYKYTFLELER